jgi:hypothetical protein
VAKQQQKKQVKQGVMFLNILILALWADMYGFGMHTFALYVALCGQAACRGSNHGIGKVVDVCTQLGPPLNKL